VHTSQDKSAQKRLGLISGLVYDPRRLLGVTTARPRVPGVLQMVSELTLTVLPVRTGQLSGKCGVWVRDVGTYA
jgi:hypothetical protein